MDTMITLPAIAPVSGTHRDAAMRRHGELATPPGSLGRLETLGAQLAAIAQHCPPPVPRNPVVLVAAGDHGVHAQGISDWPREVTALVAATLARGASAASAIARCVSAPVWLLDVGIDTPRFSPTDEQPGREMRWIAASIGPGTADVTQDAAMSRRDCQAAVDAGRRAIDDAFADPAIPGPDLLALGDLGIGNTTTSSCLVAALTGLPAAEVTGQGANLDGSKVARKVDVVERALARHGPDRDPAGVLASLGGYEHAALVGAMAAAAARRIPVILDGFVVGAAALVAHAIEPAITSYTIASHRSAEPGASHVLRALGLDPLFELDMRLGEASGAALAIPLVTAAARILVETATLDEILGDGSAS